jgi:recombination protein RecA
MNPILPRDPAQLDAAMARLDKQYGSGTVMRLGERAHTPVPVMSTGCLGVDLATGCGGYPRGRIIEIYGPESGGKTTLALHAIAACQAGGGVAAFVDAEHALDPTYAARLGVKVEELILSQPDDGEQALDVVETLVASGGIDLVVVDSVAALVPRAELAGEMGDLPVGLQARLMSQALRRLAGHASRQGSTIIFINQLRQKIGVTFGSNEVTTGGNALKFYSSMRLDVRRIGTLKNDGEAIANKVRVRIVKNKMAPPFRNVEMEIRFGIGVCWASDLLEQAEQLGIITRSGSWFSHGEQRLGQGRDKARDALLADGDLADKLRGQVWAAHQPEPLRTTAPAEA